LPNIYSKRYRSREKERKNTNLFIFLLFFAKGLYYKKYNYILKKTKIDKEFLIFFFILFKKGKRRR
jgi:hypothetical protein